MNCECNNNSNRVEPRIKHVYGNVLRMAIPLTLRTLVKDGDEMIVNDTDFIPSSDHLVRVVFSKGKTNYPVIATMDGNVAIIEDKGKIPVGTYDISVECYDDLGNPYRFKQNAVLYVADTTAEAGIDEEIEYEAQTWYLNAAVFLATTEIGEIGDVIDAKLEDVFGNAVYDANAKEIRFYNKDNSRVLATIDSRPFIVDGTVADVYIDVSRQVLVVVLNEDAGGRRFSVPLYLVFAEYYKKDEVDSRISSSLENYYTKSHVDSLYSSLSGRLTPVEVVFTWSYNTITSNRTVNGIYTDYANKKPIIGRYGNSVGTLLYVSSQEAAFMFGDRYDSPFILRNSDSTHWGKEDLVDGSLSIEIDADPTEDSENAVSSGGVYNAIQGFVSAIKVNNETPKYPVDGLVSLTIDSGGYEPPVGGIPKSDLAQSVQDTLDAVADKVDKESGKSLMSDAERTKLAGIAAGAEVNVQPNWTQTNTSADDYIKNKPTKVSDFTNDSGFTSNAGTITGITMNGASKGTSGVVDLGTVITAHQDISGKANASDVYTKTQTDTLLAGKQNTLTFDSTPTASSTNPVTSGGVKTYVDGKASITGITTNQDGTFTIAQSDGNSYTVNLNHVHPQYLKYELLADEAAYTALATKDSSTLYLIPETT